MKLPFKITRNTPDPEEVPDDYGEALSQAQGIPPPPLMFRGIVPPASFEEFVAGLFEGGPSMRRGDLTVEQVATEIREHMRSGRVVAIESQQACCSLMARDGLVMVTPNSDGVRKLAEKSPHLVGRAFVTFYAVDAHTGNTMPINLDAESCKKLMNALPELIAESERRRDEALDLVAGGDS